MGEDAVPSAEVKASTKGYTKAGILGLLTGLAIVALGAFVVTGRVVATDGDPLLVEAPELPPERDPNLTRAIGEPGAAPAAADAVATTTTVAAATTTAAAETTPTTLPEVIVDPDLLLDEDEDGDGDVEGDAADPDDDAVAPTTTTTSTTTTTTSTTTTTTTTSTTTTAAPGTPSPLAQEMDRILNLLPDEIEDVLVTIDVLDDQLSFGVASEEDAGVLDEFLSEVTTAPYSIRLAE